MTAWEFFNDNPIKQIKDAIRILNDYQKNPTWWAPPKNWEEEKGKHLHYAVNALLIYKESIDMLPEKLQPLAREKLRLISTEYLLALQKETRDEALADLTEGSPAPQL